MESQPNNISASGPGQACATPTDIDLSPQPDTVVSLPVSTLGTSVDSLLRAGVLTGASRPGQLASLGRFEILKLIGAGGVGLVFLARDPANGSLVAVKLLRPEYQANPVAIQRFESEARHMEQLKHPGIHGASDLAVSADRLKAKPPLTTHEILRLTREMAEALAYAHVPPPDPSLLPDGSAAACQAGLSSRAPKRGAISGGNEMRYCRGSFTNASGNTLVSSDGQ